MNFATVWILIAWLANGFANPANHRTGSVSYEGFDSYGSLDCVTPGRDPGRCIPLSDCPTLTQLLEKPTRKNVQYVRNSVCGILGSSDAPFSFIFNQPLVPYSWICCPTDMPSIDTNHKPVPLPVKCGISNLGRNRIVGGQEAPRGAWPWMAMLIYQLPNSNQLVFQCAGVLISDRHVLTASHCLHGDARLIKVRLGEHVIGSDDDGAILQELDVEKAIPHEHFSADPLKNDIALIKLGQKVVYNDYIQPICLDVNGSYDPETLVGQRATVAGWGLTQEGGNISRVLREAQVPIVSRSKCIEAHKDILNAGIDDTVMCTGYPQGGVASCQGDSGGPLMWSADRADRFYLLALVRSAVGCGRPGFPGMYTRVDPYIDWILSKM